MLLLYESFACDSRKVQHPGVFLGDLKKFPLAERRLLNQSGRFRNNMADIIDSASIDVLDDRSGEAVRTIAFLRLKLPRPDA